MQKPLTCVVGVSGDGRCTREGRAVGLASGWTPSSLGFILGSSACALLRFTLSFFGLSLRLRAETHTLVKWESDIYKKSPLHRAGGLEKPRVLECALKAAFFHCCARVPLLFVACVPPFPCGPSSPAYP